MLTYHKTTKKKNTASRRGSMTATMPSITARPMRSRSDRASALPTRRITFIPSMTGRTLSGSSISMRSQRRSSFGIGAAPEHCGKGYGQQMTRRVQHLPEPVSGKALYLEVRTWNRRAVRCYEKAGFRIAGEPIRQTTSAGDGIFYHMVKDA